MRFIARPPPGPEIAGRWRSFRLLTHKTPLLEFCQTLCTHFCKTEGVTASHLRLNRFGLSSPSQNRPVRSSALTGEPNMQPDNDISFETALGQRVEDMLDACTRCGKCVEVCPSVKPAGIADASSEDIISGVLDIVRSGEGPEPAVGLQSVNLGVLPAFKRELQLNELQAACDPGVDALVAVYHSDHRELCAHERDWPFRIINFLEVVGESMGLHRDDRYKQLKLMQDADQIVSECGDLIAEHALDAGKARDVVVKAMLDQPLPLNRGSRPIE